MRLRSTGHLASITESEDVLLLNITCPGYQSGTEPSLRMFKITLEKRIIALNIYNGTTDACM